MTNARSDAADRRFAHRLFTASDDDQGLDDDEQKQRSDAADDDGRAADRQSAADLFAPEDPDTEILPGLKNGRTVGRTTPHQPDSVPHNEFRII